MTKLFCREKRSGMTTIITKDLLLFAYLLTHQLPYDSKPKPGNNPAPQLPYAAFCLCYKSRVIIYLQQSRLHVASLSGIFGFRSEAPNNILAFTRRLFRSIEKHEFDQLVLEIIQFGHATKEMSAIEIQRHPEEAGVASMARPAIVKPIVDGVILVVAEEYPWLTPLCLCKQFPDVED